MVCVCVRTGACVWLWSSPSCDAHLSRALEEGVPSLVLRADTPVAHRKFISWMLNKTHLQRWTVHPVRVSHWQSQAPPRARVHGDAV